MAESEGQEVAESLLGIVGPLHRGFADHWVAVTGHRLAFLRAESFFPVRGGLPVLLQITLLLAGLAGGAVAGAFLGGGAPTGAGPGLGTTAGVLLGLFGGLAAMSLLLERVEPGEEPREARVTLETLDAANLGDVLRRHPRNLAVPLPEVARVRAYPTPAGRRLEFFIGRTRLRFDWLLTLSGIGRQASILRQALGDRFESEFPVEAPGPERGSGPPPWVDPTLPQSPHRPVPFAGG